MGDRRFSVLSRNGLLLPIDVRDAESGALDDEAAGANVLPKCVPGPVSCDGSGAFIGSMRYAAAVLESTAADMMSSCCNAPTMR